MRVKLAWKKRNSDNAVYLVDNPVGISNISVGPFSYGPIRVVTSAANPRIQIGTFCSIASNVTLVTDNEHPLDRVSTFPFKVFVLGLPVREATGKGGIVIDDDVWIGYGATILDGVHIGRGGSSQLGRSLPGMWNLTRSSEAFPPNPSRSASAKRSSIACSSSITQKWTGTSWRPISISSTDHWTRTSLRSC